jgi:hypothetical protein
VFDVDGDGDMDVLSASNSDHTIAWYENDGSGGFTEHEIVANNSGVRCVYAVDLDGDGDMDVLSASYAGGMIEWYENDGSEGFTEHAITTSVNGNHSVYAEDVDGDGDMDVLSVFVSYDMIAWYENDGESNFTEHVITTDAYGAYSVYAADVDGDGDMDLYTTGSVKVFLNQELDMDYALKIHIEFLIQEHFYRACSIQIHIPVPIHICSVNRIGSIGISGDNMLCKI